MTAAILPFWSGRAAGAWEPPSILPRLDDERELWIDFETDGVDHLRSKPVGLAVATRDRAWYFPTGHTGENCDESQVRRWARHTFAGKTLVGSWIKFDAHVSRNWGLPLDELNVHLRDVQHQACLLDERRRRSGLDLLAQELLGRQKVELPFDLAVVNLRDVAADQVGPYAETDACLTRDIDLAQRAAIASQGLDAVLRLEDDIILAVVEMEANGAPLDLELLERWRVEVRAEFEREDALLRVATGFPVNVNSLPDMSRLFDRLHLPYPRDPEDGSPSFSRELLLQVNHPTVRRAVRVRVLDSLLSKFFDKYARCQRDGILYYQLHQLRADERGTITGRFSSAGWEPNFGANIQQVAHPEKQEITLGDARWPVRRLFRPAVGRRWASADAKQMQYRLFAALAGNPRVLATYARDPDADFHQVVTDMVHDLTSSEMPRVLVKNVNFAKVFGAQEKKISRMLGKSLYETRQFLAAYDAAFPEVSPLIARVTQEIKARHYNEGIGYVRTVLGRRRRYPDLARLHSGLNAHIQGTEADIVKLKLLQVYNERRRLNLTMRITLHDAFDADCDGPDDARRLRELLNEPVVPSKVPIRWDVEIGDNWCDLSRVV